MNTLGIPSTRSLAVAKTGETVIREEEQPGAVLTRVAASHIRIGHLNLHLNGVRKELRSLADYTLQRHFPHAENEENRYLAFLQQVVQRRSLDCKVAVGGFYPWGYEYRQHGTKRKTIDYGPCAFMDTYDPDTVFSSIDTGGRYAYGRQPDIAVWNLARFAETLLRCCMKIRNGPFNSHKMRFSISETISRLLVVRHAGKTGDFW